MAGQDDRLTRPEERNAGDEVEERKRQEEEAARARRRRIGHAGAAAAGTAAGAVASGLAGETDLIDGLTGADADAADGEESRPLDVFDDIVQERVEAVLATAHEVLEEVESAGAGVVGDLGEVPSAAAAAPPDVSAPGEDVAQPDAGPPTGSSRPPAISRPGPPDSGAGGAIDGGEKPPDGPEPEAGGPGPPGAVPVPPASAGVDEPDAPAPPVASSPAPPPPPSASVADDPVAAGEPAPPPPPSATEPPAADTPVAAAPPAPADGSEASDGPATEPGTEEPDASDTEPSAPEPPAPGDETSASEPPASSGPTPPNDPDVPPPPDPGTSAPPVDSDPAPGTSTDGEDVVVDVDPGGPPPATDFPEPPQSSGPPDDDTSGPGDKPAPPPPSDGDTSVRYLGAGNTYAHPADVGEPLAVYDDYPLGPDGPVSIALYEGGASVVTYPNGNYYVTWHVDEQLDPVHFDPDGRVGQYLDNRGHNDYAVHISGNEVDVITESLDTARAFVIDDMDLEGYPGLADPAALGWEPVHEELNEAGQLVRYYETPEGEQIVHTVQRTDEMITNIVYPNGVMIEQLEYEDEPYIYLWDEEEGDWQQVVWDEDYGGYLPAVWDPAAGEYVPVPPEDQYTYEELLAEWEGQELIFPDAIGYIGIAGGGSVDPHAMIAQFGEPEVREGNGYYELTWHIGADGDTELAQRFYNDGSGRVTVQFEDWVRATWVDGEPAVEVYYQGDWRPTIFVEEWGIFYYTIPDPYTGEPMLAYIDPVIDEFIPGVINEADDNVAPAAYDTESGEWVEAVWDLSVNAYVPVDQAVYPAHYDYASESWIAEDPDYVPPEDEPLDFSGQVYGPDGGYPFPGDVAEVVHHQEAADGNPQMTFYSNGAVVVGGGEDPDSEDTFYGRYYGVDNANTSVHWLFDADGNPADFTGLTPPVTRADLDAYIADHGYYNGYTVYVDDAGNVVSGGIPWDFAGGIDMQIEGLEDWQDPAVAYGFEDADFTFNEYGHAIYTWELDDGTLITRTTSATGGWVVQYGTPPDAYQLANNQVYVWNAESGDWTQGVWDPYLDRAMPGVLDEATGEYVPALWDEESGQYVAVTWDEESGSWLQDENGVAYEGPPQYAADYIPDETYIPEVLDPLHPDTVLLRYPDGALHEFGYDDDGQRYHYAINEQTGYAVEVTGEDPYLRDIGPPPIFEFNETNHVLQPDGTLLVATGTPNQDYIIQSIDAGEGIVVTQTGYTNGAVREYDLDGDTTYVTYIYPDGTRSAREISDDMQLLSVDEASGAATFIDEDGDIVRLDGSGYKTILSLSSDSAEDYDIAIYELPEDPDYYAWDEQNGWEPYADPNALDNLIDDAEPPNYPGYDAGADQNYAPQLLESPHADMVRLQFPDGTVHEFDYEGNHYLIHDAGGADEYAQLVEGGPELYPSYGGMVQFRMPTASGYRALYIDTATGEVVTPTAIQSVDFDVENGVVRYAYNDRTHVYDLNGEETWWSYQPTGDEWSDPIISPSRQLLEIQAGPPPRAIFQEPDGSVHALESDGNWTYLTVSDQYAANMGMGYHDYENYELGEALYWDEETGGWAIPESGGEFSVGLDAIELEEAPIYSGYDPSDYPDNDVLTVLEPADPDGYRAQLSDGEIYEWSADGAMYHIQVDAEGREYATAVQGGPLFGGYVGGLAQFSSNASSYLINGDGELQRYDPVGAIQEIDVEDGYVNFGDVEVELRGDQTYRLDQGSNEWVLSEDVQLLALEDDPPMAYFWSQSEGNVTAVSADGTMTYVWVSESTAADADLNPDDYASVDGAEPLYYVDGGWVALEEAAPEQAEEPSGEPDEAPEDEGEAVDATAYLGPDGVSYPHPYWIYDSSPVVDAADTAELLGWPEGSAAYLYPGGELVMQYSDGTTRVAWLEHAETGAPVTSFDEIANGQAVIDYAVVSDANGQLVSTSVPPGADDPIAGWTTLFSINNAEEGIGAEDGAAEGSGGEELEPIDFSEEAPPEEPEQAAAPADEGAPADEPELAEDEETFAPPEAEADPAAGLDPVPGADEDGLPPGGEEITDAAGDVNDDDDGLP